MNPTYVDNKVRRGAGWAWKVRGIGGVAKAIHQLSPFMGGTCSEFISVIPDEESPLSNHTILLRGPSSRTPFLNGIGEPRGRIQCTLNERSLCPRRIKWPCPPCAKFIAFPCVTLSLAWLEK